MPRDLTEDDLETRAARLNAWAEGRSAQEILAKALEQEDIGPVAMVSSFGADSVVLLHLAAQIDPSLPVLFLDTQMLFPETLTYQREVAQTLGLTGVQVIRPDPKAVLERDPDNILHLAEPDACCQLRKTEPLDRALAPYGAWITGRKRFQTGARAALQPFEVEEGRLKVNPLANWSAEDLRDHMDAHDLPRHPLVAKGYASIGCAPCTTPVKAGEDPRAGRWRGRDKDECGIHFVNGRVVRGNAA
ncbi:phosphoadenylyl-sulfate reductase [Acidimangrovimonas sediminis]|uniref:phosphoadenylyl-sulfate reductase n=1 Tax=Acidimangrovimonas sediminis TaxID=2056283 RepID=UPI000C7FDF65|nr:phosphoadenylyl-sulfate reductase [Acidimangrovimonas sediminis]